MTLPISPGAIRGLAGQVQKMINGPGGPSGEAMNGFIANNSQGVGSATIPGGTGLSGNQTMTTAIGPGGAVVSGIERGQGVPLRAPNQGESFSDLLADAIGDVSRLQETSRDSINAFLRGDPVELHEVMAAAEEASLSLELLVEIRNKLADAYRTIMNMQA